MKFEKDETGITVKLSYDEAYLLGEGMSADIGYRDMEEKRVHSRLSNYLQEAAFFHRHGYKLEFKMKEDERKKIEEEERIERLIREEHEEDERMRIIREKNEEDELT